MISKVLEAVVVARNLLMILFFFVGCVSIMTTQFVFLHILKDHASYKQSMINLTKRHFIQLLTFVLSVVSPVSISITYDKSFLPETDSFKELTDHVMSTCLTPNSVLISNHQIYTDWFYIWFIAYTSNLADNFFIIMKDMSKVPILGYGMKNFNFMFLSRKWEKDKVVLANQLLEIDANARGSGPASGIKHVASANVTPGVDDVRMWPKHNISDKIFPYEIIIYPEGTVPSKRTIGVSQEYCRKNNLPLLQHVLLPRVRGLFLVLRNLRNTEEVLYDITTGYGGLKPGQCGEDVFTLKKVFFAGKGPKHVNYHIRSFNIKDIPLGEETLDIDDVKEDDLKKFESWLYNVWYEKDERMKQFYKTGSFESSTTNTVFGDVKLRSITELVPIFGTFGILCLIGYLLIRLLTYLVKLLL